MQNRSLRGNIALSFCKINYVPMDIMTENNAVAYIKEFLSNNYDVSINDILLNEIENAQGSSEASPEEALSIVLNAISATNSLESNEKSQLTEMLKIFHELSIWGEYAE